MDAVSYAVTKVRQSIPRQLLDEAFKPQRYDPFRNTRRYDNVLTQSIDDLIRTKVIDGMVALDLEQFAGTEDMIDLNLATMSMYDPWNAIYRFDSKALGGRNIIKVHEVIYGMNVGHGATSSGVLGPTRGMLNTVVKDVMRASVGVGSTSSAYVELIGPNTILINDITSFSTYSRIRCTLSMDSGFSEIKPVYRKDFADLVVCATKAYIYNTLIIDVDEGVIRSGKTIGAFKQILDNYADQMQIYDEMLEGDIRKAFIMNDTEQYRKVLKMILGARSKFG